MKLTIANYYSLLNRGTGALQSPFLLLVRLYWGWQFIQTGWGKFNNISGVTAFFRTLGIPFPGLNAQLLQFLQ